MSELDRRTFLRNAAATAGGVAASGSLVGLTAGPAAARRKKRGRGRHGGLGYGPLAPVADLREGDSAERLALPAGFAYRSFGLTGELTDDGAKVPGKPDGMAAYRGRGGSVVLLRNHEIGNTGPLFAPPGGTSDYDASTAAGVAGLEVTLDGHLRRSWVAMNGTMSNCAAGPTPWGTFLTNEESINGPDVGPDFTGSSNQTLTEKHGYVYEVPTDGSTPSGPITAAGRFAHEGVAVDPETGVLYMTEDDFAFPSGFYRYLSPQGRGHGGHGDDGDDDRRRDWKHGRSRRLEDGGRLDMLAVVGQPELDLTGHIPNGTTFRTRWVKIKDPDPTFPTGTTNDQAIRAVADQGLARGACFFSRLEGAVWSHGAVWFTSTQGGEPQGTKGGLGDGGGQVWAYDPKRRTLTMVYESPSADLLDMPDNIGVSPHGTFILCEDGNDTVQFLRGLTPRGEIFDFAKNISVDAKEEFAGACWSHDGSTLFVNLQQRVEPARTFAIWGPWRNGAF